MKNNKKWIIGLLCTTVAAATAGGVAACKEEAPPVNYGESGAYYFELDGREYLLTLMNKQILLQESGTELQGSYSYNGKTFRIYFSGEDAIDATYEDGVLSFARAQVNYRFIRRVEYAVTYQVEGASSVQTSYVVNGKTLAKPADPVKDGYTFIGWYVDSDYTTAFLFDAEPITENTTLYARFEQTDVSQEEFTVRFDTAGGQAIEPQITKGCMIPVLPTPVKEGHKFIGWYVSDYQSREKLTYRYTGQGLNANTTLFAVWEESGKPVLSVNEKGVSWTSVSLTAKYQVIIRKDGEVVDIRNNVTATTHAFSFAEREAGDYQIEVISGGKSGYASYKNKALARVSLFSVAEPSMLVFNGVPNAEKYLITVKCGNESHTHTLLNNGLSTNYNFASCAMQEGGIRFTVQAVANGYASSVSDEFVFERKLAQIERIQADNSQVAWSRVIGATGYRVVVSDGTQTLADTVVNDTNFSLLAFTGNLTVRVTPVANGYLSPESATASVQKTALASPQISVFGGVISWNAVTGATGYRVKVGKTVHEVSGTSYTLTADELAGDNVVVSVQVVAEQPENDSVYSKEQTIDVTALSTAPTYANGVLTWSPVAKATAYSVKINDGLAQRVENATSLAVSFSQAGVNTLAVAAIIEGAEPIWQTVEVTVYTVIFDACGGTPADTLYLAYGDALALPESELSGYDFEGWYNVPDGLTNNGAKYQQDYYTEKSDKVLYACWSPKKIELTLQIAEGNTQSYIVQYMRPYSLPVPQAIDATKTFDGWFTEPNGAGIRYSANDGLALDIWRKDGAVTLYAAWVDSLRFEETVSADGVQGYAAFAGNEIAGLTSVTVPASYNGKPVIALYGGAFANCSRLVEINIPDTIITVNVGLNGVTADGSAFGGCTSLQRINVYNVVGNAEKVYFSVDGVLFYKNTIVTSNPVELVFFSPLRTGSYAMPAAVEEIYVDAHGAQTVVDVHPITHIPSMAFYGSPLTELTLPATLASVGNNAFENMPNLKTVTFENFEAGSGTAPNLMIGSYAFKDCDALETVNLPAQLRLLNRSTIKVAEDSFGGEVEIIDAFPTDIASLTINVAEGGVAYSSKNGMLCTANGREILYARTTDNEIKIPVGVNSIGDFAFYFCKNMQKVTIPFNVRNVGKGAFAGNTNLEQVIFEGEKGDTALTVGDRAFYNTGLKSLVLPQNLKTMGKHAFGKISSLKEVTVNATGSAEGLDYASTAFSNNDVNGTSYITKLTIGDEVPALDIKGIFGGKTLTKVIVSAKNTNYVAENNVLYNAGKTEILLYPTNKSSATFEIPTTVTRIGARTFMGVTALKSITIGKQITEIGAEAFSGCTALATLTFETRGAQDASLVIGDKAFYRCKALTAVALDAKTTHIGAYAFANTATAKNTALTSLVIPEGVTNIGDYAFAYNGALASVALPASLQSMGGYEGQNLASMKVFEGCSSLATLSVSAQNTEFVTIDNILYLKNGAQAEALIFCPQKISGAVVIPNTTTNIWSGVFKGTGITDVSFNGAVSSAFAFETAAFDGCEALKTVVLPVGMTEIPNRLFNGCTALTSVSVPATVTVIGSQAFAGCSKLSDLQIAEGTAALRIEDGISEGAGAFAGTKALVNVTLPARTSYLGAYAFYNGGVTQLQIPDRVNTIGNGCFYKSALTAITFGADSGLFSIGDSAFANTMLTAFDMPDTVQTLGARAFYGCYDLANLNLSTELDELPSYLFADELIAEGLGEQAFALANVNFGTGSKLAKINQAAFLLNNAPAFTQITLPENLKNIEARAFSGTAITQITLPVTLIHLGASAFENCTALEQITFAAGESALETVGNSAFAGTAITAFVFPDTQAQSLALGANLFANTNLNTLHLSPSVTKLGSALNGCTTITNFTVDDANEFYSLDDIDPIIYNKKSQSIAYIYGLIVSETFTIREGTSALSNGVFQGQINVKHIVIPASLMDIGDSVFAGCTGLQQVTFTAGSKLSGLGAGVFENCSNLLQVNLPEGITLLPANTFSGCSKLQAVTLPNSLLYINNTATTDVSAESSAFAGCTALQQIALPSGLLAVGARAFAGCTALQTVTLQDSGATAATKFGAGAFAGCVNLSSFAFNNEVTEISNQMFDGCAALTAITLPEKVTVLGVAAFRGTGLREMVIPEQITSLGAEYNVSTAYELFANCKQLTSVTLPSKLNMIGAGTFSGCAALQTVTYAGNNGANNALPDTVTLLGDSAFAGTGLKNITLPKIISASKCGSALFANSALEGVTFHAQTEYLAARMFENCVNLTQISLPAILTADSVGDGLLSGCTALQQVTLGAGTAYLGKNMFYGCAKIQSFTIPQTVVSVGEGCFRASGLTQITVPDTVKTLGDYAFADCDALAQVTLPNAYTALNEGLFSGCGALQTITLPTSLQTIGASCFAGSGLHAIALPATVKTLEDNCFANTEISAITLHEGVEKIGAGVFSGCANLTEIALPNTVTDLGERCFSNSGLTQVTSFGGLKSIGSGMFTGCNDLVSITLPTTISSIDENAFSGTSIQQVILQEGLQTIGVNAFANCANLTEIALPASLTALDESAFAGSALQTVEMAADSKLASVGANAFASCEDLTDVNLGNNYTALGEGAFQGCIALQSIVLSAKLESLGANAFKNCTALSAITYQGYEGTGNALPELITVIDSGTFVNCTSLTDLQLPDNPSRVSSLAFTNCGITAITIPAATGAHYMGLDFLSGFTNLTEFRLTEAGEQNFKIEGGMLYNATGTRLLKVPAGLTGAVTVPEGVTFEARAFKGCVKVTSVNIPDSVTEIGDSMFEGCTGLTTVTFGENSNIREIKTSAFDGCTSLANFLLPETVRVIHSYAFRNCTALTSIQLPISDNNTLNGRMRIMDNAFSGSGLTSLAIYDPYICIGPSAFADCLSLTTVTLKNFAGKYIPSYGSNPIETYNIFKGCTMLSSVNIEETTLSRGMFLDCSALTQITISEGNKIIPIQAFEGSGLTSVTIPASVMEIAEYAFANCANLSQEDVTFVGDAALIEIAPSAFSAPVVEEQPALLKQDDE